jgi:hypothetical protein
MPVIAIILFGILAASFALALELLATGLSSVSLSSLETLSLKALLILAGIALIEEASKYVFLRQYASRFFVAGIGKPALLTASLLGAGFGIGFAVPEIFFLYSGAIASPALAFIATAGLHLATSIAFAISIFSFSERRFSAFLILSAAILLHLSYNAAVISFL